MSDYVPVHWNTSILVNAYRAPLNSRVAWLKILILAQAKSAGSSCYGALARLNNLNAFSGDRY
jgi:hypothetical protein